MPREVSNKAPIKSGKKRKAAVLELTNKLQVSFVKASLLLRVELTSNTSYDRIVRNNDSCRCFLLNTKNPFTHVLQRKMSVKGST